MKHEKTKRTALRTFPIALAALFTLFAVTACNPPASPDGDGSENPPSHEHTFGDWVTENEETCETEGTATRICSCGKSETKTITPKAHTYKDGACSVCNASHLNYRPYGVDAYVVTGIAANCTHTKIKIPRYEEGKPVTAIEYRAFYQCDSITEITIPNSIGSIGQEAFKNCDMLTEITVPSGVTHIGEQAFSSCDSLTSVTLAEGVTFIGGQAFSSCSALTDVTLPESIAHIGWLAFGSCSNLNYHEYDNARYLGNAKNPYLALIEAKNTDIKSCKIHSDVKVVVETAFEQCRYLHGNEAEGTEYDNAVYLGTESNPYLVLITVKDRAVASCNVHENTKTIASSAFAGCTELANIVIPEGVTAIGVQAFALCTSLTNIVIPKGVASISYAVFSECASLTDVTIPNSVIEIGDAAFLGCSALTNVTIPNGVIYINTLAFQNCTSLTSVTIPSSVTFIGNYAFDGCASLTDVTVPDGAYVADEVILPKSSEE